MAKHLARVLVAALVIASVLSGQAIAAPVVSAVSAGGYYSLALAADGTVYQWGAAVSLDQILTPAQVPGLKDVKAVAAGREIEAAVKNDGTLWALAATWQRSWAEHRTTYSPTSSFGWRDSVRWCKSRPVRHITWPS